MYNVAKSYAGLPQITTEYVVKGRTYVDVQLKNGNTKKVRTYTDAEYARMYPEVEPEVREFKTQKEVLGFSLGYVTIFTGNTYEQKDWLKEHGARFTRIYGWSIPGGEEPAEYPEDITPIRLNWEVVGTDKEVLKPEEAAKAAVEALIYPAEGEFVGSIGDKIEIEVTVEKAIPLDTAYGTSTIHVMRDAEGRVYVWKTTAKTWTAGTTHRINGTIKEYKTYRNVKQNILTRCTEIN